MAVPQRFSNLPDSAFPRLRGLLAGIDPQIDPGQKPVVMTIGEPRHAMPDFLTQVLADNVDGFTKYPPNEGSADLLAAISDWIAQRHGVILDTTRITVLNGTREGLFNAALALCPETKNGQRPAVLMPNPFYQVYAVAAAAVAADPVYVPATPETGNLPDYAALDPDILDRTALVYVCSPANPQGAVASEDYLEHLILLAERHDFLVLSDECYSEIWRDNPPVGALSVAARLGLDDRVVMFNSLSKRSNMPGLRSGFAAGGAQAMKLLRQLRITSGAPVPLTLQAVSAAAWRDEAHVQKSLEIYQQKYAIADRILGNVPGYKGPDGGFFLWLPVPDGEAAAVQLWREAGIQVLPGAYLSRSVDGKNPGTGFIRVALVAAPDETESALIRLRDTIYNETKG